jgi:hypothetical protein
MVEDKYSWHSYLNNRGYRIQPLFLLFYGLTHDFFYGFSALISYFQTKRLYFIIRNNLNLNKFIENEIQE